MSFLHLGVMSLVRRGSSFCQVDPRCASVEPFPTPTLISPLSRVVSFHWNVAHGSRHIFSTHTSVLFALGFELCKARTCLCSPYI